MTTEDLFDAALLSEASEETWRDAFQRLKPGAHALGVGNHELWDLMSIHARAAGFEVRDSIAVQMPGLSWYPVMIFRKPIEEKTVTAQVLATGTGVMNIDGTRVKHSSQADLEQHKAGVEAIKARGGSMGNSWKNSSDLSGASDVTSAGRWPPNFVLVHSPECRDVSNVQGPATSGHGTKADSDGTETIAVWECSPECPSKALGGQSGFLKSGTLDPSRIQAKNKIYGPRMKKQEGFYEQNEGTASRFYPHFTDTQELLGWLVKLVCPEGGRFIV